jgi:2-methylisocitrate lyase-like PEP mutase family enzyme
MQGNVENAISFEDEMLQQEYGFIHFTLIYFFRLLVEEEAAEKAREQTAINYARTQQFSNMSMPIKTGVEQLVDKA